MFRLLSRWQTRRIGRSPEERARWALVAVALFEIGLFAVHHWDQWRHGLVPLGTPQTLAGEGLVVYGDGYGYYAWLRSALIDHDWSFDNEFNLHRPLDHHIEKDPERTEIGRRPNPWSIGPACIWALAVVPGHGTVQLLQSLDLPWAADGYTLPYQLMVGCTTLLAGILGLVHLYGICRHFARPTRAALAAALMTLGTTIVYYQTIEVSMGHGLGAAVLAALVWCWLRSYGSKAPGRWLLIGALVGLASLMRWQLATFAILPAGEALLACIDGLRLGLRDVGKSLLGLALAALAGAVVFFPQMYAWHCVYGQWLGSPMKLAHNWLHPNLWQVLASQDRSLFYWTPLTLLAAVGFLWAFRSRHGSLEKLSGPGKAPLVLLAGAILVQVYALASIQGDGVYLGSAYGFRQLTEMVVALAPGLALLLERATPRVYRWLGALGCALLLWNLVLICQHRQLLLSAESGASLEQLLRNIGVLARRKPLLLLGQGTIPFVLMTLLVSPRTRTADRTPRPRRASGRTPAYPIASRTGRPLHWHAEPPRAASSPLPGRPPGCR
jgi:hypothetical protein